MRLVSGSSYNEGRVEVYYSGRWGTVCNDGWNDDYASRVCRQLGFGSGELANFGPGTGNIILEKVLCTVNNTILASCGHYGVYITVRCSHNNDVGVKCHGKHIIMLFMVHIIMCNIHIRYNNNIGRESYANYCSRINYRISNVKYFAVV